MRPRVAVARIRGRVEWLGDGPRSLCAASRGRPHVHIVLAVGQDLELRAGDVLLEPVRVLGEAGLLTAARESQGLATA